MATTYLEAAYIILQQAKRPLHYREITKLALEQSLIQPSGITPEATMGSRLYTNTTEEGSRFVRVGQGLFDLARPRRGDLDEQVEQINFNTRRRLRQLLAEIPPERFEALITELLLRMGFDEKTVKVTPYSGDGGIDVTGIYRAAGLTEVDAAVQAKRWKSNVQAPTITQLRGSLQVHQQGIIITTSDFSKGARTEAIAPNKTRIGLINGDELLDLLVKHGVGVVERSLKITSLDEEWWGELVGHLESSSLKNGTMENNVSAQPDAAQNQETPPGFTKPVSFTLWAKECPVKSWKEMLVLTAGMLAVQQGPAFWGQVAVIRGRKRQYIAETAEGMIGPVQLAGTNLWIETNQSAKSCLELIGKLLDATGNSRSDFSYRIMDSSGQELLMTLP